MEAVSIGTYTLWQYIFFFSNISVFIIVVVTVSAGFSSQADKPG